MLKSVRYLDAETMAKAAHGDDGESDVTPEIAKTIAEAKNIDGQPGSSSGSHRVHMRLLERPQMTTLALPKSATWPSDAIPPVTAPWHFLPDVLTFSRFTLATPEYMMNELQRELGELKGEWDALNGDTLGRSFVQTAREKIERQMGKVTNELVTDVVRRNEAEARESWDEAEGGVRRERERQLERERQALERAQQQHDDDKGLNVPVEFLAASSTAYDGPTVRVPPNLTVEPNPMPVSRKSKPRKNRSLVSAPPSTPPAPAQFFYQSSLGANVFLNPLDGRILLTQFGSASNMPDHVSLPVTGYDSATVSDDLRKRVKYLGHLPVGTEVVFVETDLKDIVSKETLAQFEQPLKARRDKRRARTRREDRDKRRWEEAEKAKQPPEVHVVQSAFAPSSAEMDSDLALALERSRLDSDTSAFPTMGSSPPQPNRSPVAPASSSFASALRAAPTQRNAIAENWRAANSEEINGVWGSLNEPEADTPTGKKKGRKGKKLVFGGAGRQA